MTIDDELKAKESKLRDLNAKIKNAENTLRQVNDAVSSMRTRLDRYESDLRKAMRG